MATRPVIRSLFGLALVAGACSASSEEAGSPADLQVTTTTTPAELAFVDKVDPDATLRLALTRPETADPFEISLTDQDAVVVADLLHDGLTEASGAVLRPGVATSWSANGELMSWTFVLDTDRVTAADVVSSFERLQRAAPNSAAVQLLESVESIEAQGYGIVTFKLSKPSAGFPWILSGVQYSVVLDEGLSGRYVIAEDNAKTMSLESATVADIDISWFEDGGAALYNLTLGEVDAAVVDPAEARAAGNLLGQLPSPRSIVRFYGLNMASDDFADPSIREAALLSINRPAVLDEMPTAGFTADGAAGASTAGYRFAACDMACIYNPETSRTLLRQAGVKPTLSIVYVGEDQQAVAEEIASSLREGGFRTEVTEATAEELPSMIADGSAEIFSYGWVAPGPSMDAVIPALFSSTSPLNAFGYSSPLVDGLLAEASVTVDDNARWELLDEAHRLALADWIMIPVAVAFNGLVQSPDLPPLALRPDGSVDVMSIR